MDGVCTIPYLKELAAILESTSWSLFSVRLTSSYTGFGLSSLGKDVEEIAQCVEYVRSYKKAENPDRIDEGKVVIMGHSTGSQDVLHYIYMPNPLLVNPRFGVGLKHIKRPQVDGAIMQGAVSDREAVHAVLTTAPPEIANVLQLAYTESVAMAKEAIYAENDTLDVLLPLSLTSKLGFPASAPLGARRFLSLVSPDSPQSPEEDDLFSSDLTDKRLEETFGMIATRGILKSKLMVLLSGNDQFQTDDINKETLLMRWKAATNKTMQNMYDDENSGVILGANHSLRGPDQAAARGELAKRVAHFLKLIEDQSKL
jgi:hypothetical protein